jgi:hypothetical protein
MKYRFAGKEKKLSFGTYPDISLAEARTKRDEARKTWQMIKIPVKLKKPNYLPKISVTNTLIAVEWYNAKVSGWSKTTLTMLTGPSKTMYFPLLDRSRLMR